MFWLRNKKNNFLLHTRNLEACISIDKALFPANWDFCDLLLTFANCLDPDQKNVRPDLDPNLLTP